MNSIHVRRLIDRSLELWQRGCQDPESTAMDVVHGIVGAGDRSDLSYFLTVAPKPVVEAGVAQMTGLKDDFDFMIPPFFWGPHDIPKDELEAITLERKTMYEEIYEVLRQEAASLGTESGLEIRPDDRAS